MEDVISVEDSVSEKIEVSPCQVQDSNIDSIPVKVDLAAKRAETALQEVPGVSSNCNFLVLEVFLTTSMIPWSLFKNVNTRLIMLQLIFCSGI